MKLKKIKSSLSFYLKEYEVTCDNYYCNNPPSNSKGYKGHFCKSCWNGVTSFSFKCTVCDNVYTKSSTLSRLPKYCSDKCRQRGGYIINRVKHGYKVKCKGDSLVFDQPNRILDLLEKGKVDKYTISEYMGWKVKNVRHMISYLRKDGYDIVNEKGYYILLE